MSGRAKKRVGLVVAVAVLLLVLTAAPASSTDTLNRPLLTRTGTFSITLKKHGRTIGAFVCRMSATQFQRGFRVKASPESGWLSLPAGRWDLAMAIRVDSYRPKA